jgi:peroxiredoxin
MARTPSTMLELGTPLPDFRLPDTLSGRTVSPGDFAGNPLLVMFLCNHCPFVKHVQAKLAEFGRTLPARGIELLAISSNDVNTHPDDSPEKMREEGRKAAYSFPYCFDESQSVARAFRAACTPDFFLFDRQHRLFYRGQLDDSRPGNNQGVTGADILRAIDALLAGKKAEFEQRPSLGCNIKWKPGAEPDYYQH